MKISKLDEAAHIKKQLDKLENLRGWATRADSFAFALSLSMAGGDELSCDLERWQFVRVVQGLIEECNDELVKLGVEL